MFLKTVNLWEAVPGLCQETPTLDIYVPRHKTSDIAVVILPGGGYGFRAEHEGKGYAEFLNAQGITAFVCQYRVNPHLFPLPLMDARRAVQYVRHYRDTYGICKDKVYIMGSSAGGHLAALTCTYRSALSLEQTDAIDREDHLPSGQILCYPVIALLGKGISHLSSGRMLLGEQQAELGEELSPHLIADAQTPRAFIWHTFDDEAVPVTNTLLYAQRLRQVGVNAEVHIYPHGRHGLGIATGISPVENWTKELFQWLTLKKD